MANFFLSKYENMKKIFFFIREQHSWFCHNRDINNINIAYTYIFSGLIQRSKSTEWSKPTIIRLSTQT